MTEPNNILALIEQSVTPSNYLAEGEGHAVFHVGAPGFEDVLLRVPKALLSENQGHHTTPNTGFHERIVSTSSLKPISNTYKGNDIGQALLMLYDDITPETSLASAEEAFQFVKKVPGTPLRKLADEAARNAEDPVQARCDVVAQLLPHLPSVMTRIAQLGYHYEGRLDPNTTNLLFDTETGLHLIDAFVPTQETLFANETPADRAIIAIENVAMEVMKLVRHEGCDTKAIEEELEAYLLKLAEPIMQRAQDGTLKNVDKVGFTNVRSNDAVALSQPPHQLREALNRVENELGIEGRVS